MKIRVFILIVSVLLLMPRATIAQSEQTTAASPPLSQPLVREGDFASKLADALKLGAAESETEAESLLISVGIAPGNGWMADYPVTPDIIGELQTSISDAADSGKLTMGKDEALKIFQDVISESDLSAKEDTSGQAAGETSGAEYPDSTVINNYYYDEGPPVVTYYAPPPDYAYLYTWVPYPFWWWDFWFPGFFVLVDFDVRVHGHGHRHGHGEFISNHFRDLGTGRISRIDPTNRSHGGTFARTGGGARPAGPSARSGAQTILNNSRAGRAAPGTYKEYRGYGVTRPSAGTRSSAFERSGNSRFERSASDRGFQSRSNAGQIPGGVGPRGVGGGGSRSGGGGFRGGEVGGFHGGGGRR
jgi:hypothetical protein